MAKYDFDFKKKVVLAYLKGEGGKDYLAKKYSVASSHHILEWVNNYNMLGDEGLKRSRKKESYSFEKKLNIVHNESNSMGNPVLLFPSSLSCIRLYKWRLFHHISKFGWIITFSDSV
ncbi:Transposase and inactivated derivatives [Butyrivibrio sp. M55]|nr:Transposase and inactivated derivatives [Butyrivibrio sp. M55]